MDSVADKSSFVAGAISTSESVGITLITVINSQTKDLYYFAIASKSSGLKG